MKKIHALFLVLAFSILTSCTIFNPQIVDYKFSNVKEVYTSKNVGDENILTIVYRPDGPNGAVTNMVWRFAGVNSEGGQVARIIHEDAAVESNEVTISMLYSPMFNKEPVWVFETIVIKAKPGVVIFDKSPDQLTVAK